MGLATHVRAQLATNAGSAVSAIVRSCMPPLSKGKVNWVQMGSSFTRSKIFSGDLGVRGGGGMSEGVDVVFLLLG